MNHLPDYRCQSMPDGCSNYHHGPARQSQTLTVRRNLRWDEAGASTYLCPDVVAIVIRLQVAICAVRTTPSPQCAQASKILKVCRRPNAAAWCHAEVAFHDIKPQGWVVLHATNVTEPRITVGRRVASKPKEAGAANASLKSGAHEEAHVAGLSKQDNDPCI